MYSLCFVQSFKSTKIKLLKHFRQLLTSTMDNSRQKKKSLTGDLIHFDGIICIFLFEHKFVIMKIQTTKGKAGKREAAWGPEQAEQEAGGDVWSATEADPEFGKELRQAGCGRPNIKTKTNTKRKTKEKADPKLSHEVGQERIKKNTLWGSNVRQVSWRKVWTLSSQRFGS